MLCGTLNKMPTHHHWQHKNVKIWTPSKRWQAMNFKRDKYISNVFLYTSQYFSLSLLEQQVYICVWTEQWACQTYFDLKTFFYEEREESEAFFDAIHVSEIYFVCIIFQYNTNFINVNVYCEILLWRDMRYYVVLIFL